MHGKIIQRDKKTLDFQNESCILIIELIIKRENMLDIQHNLKQTDSIFIDTHSNKTIGVYIGVGNLVGTAKNALELLEIIKKNKIDLHMTNLFFCSGMDFATEVGFDDDGDARKIFFDMQALWLEDMKKYFDVLAKN
tara:strand:+ start:470 stop:880 length:411 start_codon:yes stop_codon:yes gene_type:complete